MNDHENPWVNDRENPHRVRMRRLRDVLKVSEIDADETRVGGSNFIVEVD